ncbi:carotenoid oxygenase family protein [Paraburkholderia sediminicola]|uniref:carotenoid oxygenase family protein n=1 Tax=Paraburkholderia sediminicola TaxID=458836 RepID=UPI0038BA5097
MNERLNTNGYRANLAPIDFEVDCGPLPVRGELPSGLAGVLVRNGPNPLHPDPAQHWFAGHGMVHRFEFANGGVTYRNRWVRTQRWLAERAGAAADFTAFGARPQKEMPNDDGVANTNVLMHGNRLLALEEAHLPVELHARTLDTLGQVDFGGELQGAFTAHPKVDPDTGELLFFGYGGPDGLGAGMTAGSIDTGGRVTHLKRFDAPYASMVHDFAFSAGHLLFPVTPLTASKARMHAGLPPYAWEPQFGSFVGVLRRDGSGEVEWWKGPACFVFHVMNAWEDDDCICIDVMQLDAPPNFTWPDGRTIDGAGHARLCRWTLDRRGRERVFTSGIIAEVSGEFPRIDERFAGAPYRHGWLAAHPDDGGEPFSQIARVDHANPRALDIYRLADGDATSEPVFVPRTIDAAEGDGWILAVAYRGAEQRSDLLVFDALRVAAGPIATVEIPHRVPNGFHGNWVAARQ